MRPTLRDAIDAAMPTLDAIEQAVRAWFASQPATDAEIEAAANAIWVFAYDDDPFAPSWDNAAEAERDNCRTSARLALEAVRAARTEVDDADRAGR